MGGVALKLMKEDRGNSVYAFMHIVILMQCIVYMYMHVHVVYAMHVHVQ